MSPPESPARGEPAVALRAVWKIYGHTPALRGVTMAAWAGRVLALLGPNGAGKSTILRIAAGVACPTRGTVRVRRGDPRSSGVRREIGFAGHRTFLYGALTVEENLRFYADLYGLPPGMPARALDRFGLADVRRRRVAELSRGFAQRVNLARALLHEPGVVLLDEPFTGLDATVTEQLTTLLGTLREAGCTVVLATHEWEAARGLADDAAVVVGGRVVLRTRADAVAPDDLPALYAGTAPAEVG